MMWSGLSETRMFAVIKTGGKQYRVVKDDRIVVEKLNGEPGSMVEFNDVLMIGESGKVPTIGLPRLDKAAVFAEVLEQGRADKIIVFKKKRRKNYRRTKGHRQDQTVLRIIDVSPTGTKPKAAAKTKAPAKKEAAKKDKVEKVTAAKKKPAQKATPKKTTAKKAAPKKAVEKMAAPKKAGAKAETKAAVAKKKAPAKSKAKGKE